MKDDTGKMINNSQGSQKLWGRMACLICIVGFLIWSTLLTVKFYSFRYYDGDMALYAHVMWNLVHGSLYSSLLGVNFLSNHTQFVAFFIAPLYWAFSSPLTLIYLKVAAVFSGGYVLFCIARLYLNRPLFSFIIMLCYLIHPANMYMIPNEFHFEPLAIPLLFLSFYFFKKDKWGSFMMTCLTICLVKENLPAIVFMYGFLGVIKTRRLWSRWTIGPWLLGGLALWLCLFVLPPIFRQDLNNTSQVYFALYRDVLPQEGGIVSQAVAFIANVFQRFFSVDNVDYFVQVFGGGAIGLFAPHIWGLSLPIFLQNILSSESHQKSIYFHYATTMLPFIFCSVVVALSWFKVQWRYLIVMLIMLLSLGHFLQHKQFIYDRGLFDFRPRHKVIAYHAVNQVKPDEPIAANLTMLDHLTSRKELYSLLNIWRGANYLIGDLDYTLPDHVKAVLVDFGTPYYKVEAFSGKAQPERLAFLYSDAWSADVLLEDMALLRKNQGKGMRLLDRMPLTIEEGQAFELRTTSGITLWSVDYQLQYEDQFVILDASFLWGVAQFTESYLDLLFWIEDESGERIYTHRRGLAYDLWPTDLWHPGEMVKERYRYVLPEMAAGQYHLYGQLTDRSDSNEVVLFQSGVHHDQQKHYFGVLHLRKANDQKN